MMDRIRELVTSTDEDLRRQGVELAVSLGSPTTILHHIAEETRAVWVAASLRAEEAARHHREVTRTSATDAGGAFYKRMQTRAQEIEAHNRSDAADAALRLWLREMQEGE